MNGLFLAIVLLALVIALLVTGARKPAVEQVVAVEQVESVSGSSSGRVEIYRDAAGEWRWRAKAANYEIVAVSGDGYKNRKDCEHGVRVAAAVIGSVTLEYIDEL